jgi:hypothetical protein
MITCQHCRRVEDQWIGSLRFITTISLKAVEFRLWLREEKGKVNHQSWLRCTDITRQALTVDSCAVSILMSCLENRHENTLRNLSR